MLEMVVKSVSNFSYHDLSYIRVSLSQYLEFVGKLFCSILCTYIRVFDTPVPQVFVCDISEEANLVLKRIYPHWSCITHKGLRHRCAKGGVTFYPKRIGQLFPMLWSGHEF